MAERRRQAQRGDGDRLRAELVAAAIDLLLDPLSTTAPSLRTIARSCGVAPSAVYMHFASQTELMYAVSDELFSRLRAALAAAESLADPEARLTSMIDAYLAWAEEHPGAYQLLFERPDPPPDSGIGPGLDLLERLGAALAAVVPRADTTLTLQVWSVLHGIASLHMHKQEAPWQTTAQIDAHTVVDALLTARSRNRT